MPRILRRHDFSEILTWNWSAFTIDDVSLKRMFRPSRLKIFRIQISNRILSRISNRFELHHYFTSRTGWFTSYQTHDDFQPKFILDCEAFIQYELETFSMVLTDELGLSNCTERVNDLMERRELICSRQICWIENGTRYSGDPNFKCSNALHMCLNCNLFLFVMTSTALLLLFDRTHSYAK